MDLLLRPGTPMKAEFEASMADLMEDPPGEDSDAAEEEVSDDDMPLLALLPAPAKAVPKVKAKTKNTPTHMIFSPTDAKAFSWLLERSETSPEEALKQLCASPTAAVPEEAASQPSKAEEIMANISDPVAALKKASVAHKQLRGDAPRLLRNMAKFKQLAENTFTYPMNSLYSMCGIFLDMLEAMCVRKSGNFCKQKIGGRKAALMRCTGGDDVSLPA